VAVYDIYDHVRDSDDKKEHQIFGQEESAPPEKILATRMSVNISVRVNLVM